MSKTEAPSSNQQDHQRHHLDNDRIGNKRIMFYFLLLRNKTKKGKKWKKYLFDIDHNMFFLTNQQVVYPPMYGTHHLLPLALFFYCFQSTDSKASYAVE